MIKITPQQLRKAANIQEKIQSLQKELGQLLGGPAEIATIEAPKKRRMSAAGRARVAAAARARWAKIRSISQSQSQPKPRPSGGTSPKQ
jgi:hypothetical protein